jgi:hypothetical protein
VKRQPAALESSGFSGEGASVDGRQPRFGNGCRIPRSRVYLARSPLNGHTRQGVPESSIGAGAQHGTAFHIHNLPHRPVTSGFDLKTLGAFTLKVVFSKFCFRSDSVSTPMGSRAVTSPESMSEPHRQPIPATRAVASFVDA